MLKPPAPVTAKVPAVQLKAAGLPLVLSDPTDSVPALRFKAPGDTTPNVVAETTVPALMLNVAPAGTVYPLRSDVPGPAWLRIPPTRLRRATLGTSRVA